MRDILKQKLLWIAALGYFVDLYDLVLYGTVRVESLKSLGYQGNDVLSVGALLLNIQMAGMICGGVFFGILGDKKGRTHALFASITLYSLATFFNAFVVNFTGYAALRFLAGFGLAGELGAAVTLVSEILPQRVRGLGSAFIASIGFLGAVSSSWLSQQMSWQNAYLTGGALGFLLLFLRVNVRDSSLFLSSKKLVSDSDWGSIQLLFFSRTRAKLMLLGVLAGVPIWYVAGILSYFAPEFAKTLEINGTVTAGTTIMMGYLGAILGDISCGFLSQRLQSRKKAVLTFLVFGGSIALFHPLFSKGESAHQFYAIRFLIGLGNGYFATLIAWVAECFGTNLRATATSITTNLIRAAVIPLSLAFIAMGPKLGNLESSAIIGVLSFGFGILAVLMLPETFQRNLSFIEKISSQDAPH
jgi:MFS family permease